MSTFARLFWVAGVGFPLVCIRWVEPDVGERALSSLPRQGGTHWDADQALGWDEVIKGDDLQGEELRVKNGNGKMGTQKEEEKPEVETKQEQLRREVDRAKHHRIRVKHV